MERCDALIVGGGPAGSSCARILKRGGLDVLIMDREDFPRDKPCAGWITPAVLDALEIDPEVYGQGRLLQEIQEFRTSAMNGTEVTTRYRKTVSYGIRRREFDHYLLLRSAARHRLGERVACIERVADGWLVNGRIRASLLIGAGGHYCPVARVLKPDLGREAVIAAMVTEFPMAPEQQEACGIPAGVPALFFTKDLKGYGWLLRKGSFLNVGLGSLETAGLPERMREFCAFLEKRGGIGCSIPNRFRGHAYLPYLPRHARRIYGDSALLIGDAAGVSFPESGEGILPAVQSGLIAAQTVLEARGDYREERLAPYAAQLEAMYASVLGKGMELPEGVRRLGAATLLSSKWLTRRLLLDRWFLHADQLMHKKRAGRIPPP